MGKTENEGWLARASDEQKQLKSKIAKLDLFLDSLVSGEVGIDLEDLREQQRAMHSYHDVLSRRIARHKKADGQ